MIANFDKIGRSTRGEIEETDKNYNKTFTWSVELWCLRRKDVERPQPTF